MARGEATPQQKLFVEHYLKNRKTNQRQAALDAGYSPRSVDSQASQLLKNPKVLAYLEKRESQITDELRREFVFDALEARKVLLEIMNDPDAYDRDRLNAAREFLNRAGFGYIDELDQEKKRAEIERIKAETELTRAQNDLPGTEMADDGFLEALDAVAGNVWAEYAEEGENDDD